MASKKVFSVIFVLLISVSLSFSQDRLLKGRVTAFDSIPLVNATIIVKSSKQELRSDSIGNFSVICSLPEKFKVKADGFISQTVKVEEGETLVMINLDLKTTENALEKAIGSGHVTDPGNLYAMTSSKVEKDFTNYRDIYEVIRSSSSGVTIQGKDVIIRGKKSYGPDAALIILDGIEISSDDLSTLPPRVVKSVNVLKGPAAAIYGVRGANGVVEIETRRGGD